MAKKLQAFENPDHPGNGKKHHTGKACIERGCEQPAGTAWSPYWCFAHNVERMQRIDRQLNAILEGFEPTTVGTTATEGRE